MFFIGLLLTGASVVFAWVVCVFFFQKVFKYSRVRMHLIRIYTYAYFEKFRYSKILKERKDIFEAPVDLIMIKKGKIPFAAVHLIKGQVDFIFKNHKVTEFRENLLIGPDEVIHNHLSPFTVKVSKGSFLRTIGKSDLVDYKELE